MDVWVRRTPDWLLVRVADDGAPPRTAPAARRHGYGLVGLPNGSARSAARITAGPGVDGGWVVDAALPAARGGGQVIRVLIADDQAMVRTGFGMIIGAQPDMEVVGEAADGVEAVALARRLRPGRGAAGHPDAPDGRAGGAAAAGRAGRRRPDQGGRGDHLRPRRVRARGAAQRRGRLPAQGLRPGAAGRGGPRGRLRRRADQPVDHRTAAGAPQPAGAGRATTAACRRASSTS